MFRKHLQSMTLGCALSVAFVPALWSTSVFAVNLSGADVLDYTSYPVTTIENVTPMVMLTMARDHQYSIVAYNDYTDLNNDGTISDAETSYDNSFEYYGYFDPNKCYDYQNSASSGINEEFVPTAFAVNHYCDTVTGDWSGNFLNWASMTRMDIIRKIIYGGRRIVDTGTRTVLQRHYLPTDGHSFAKYYNGADISRLTPFSVRTDTTGGGDADGFDDRDEGITICNTSDDNGASRSHEAVNIPLMRIAEGNFSLWAANERWQCLFSTGQNKNNLANSGIDADSNKPDQATESLSDGSFGPEFEVHIQSCVTGLISTTDNSENCKQYPDGNFKPTGLMQEYGEDGRIEFGLMTGSYEKNVSGGVLRKNIGDVATEVNYLTNGTFLQSPTSSSPATGIVRTLDKLRIFGYRYSNGTYSGVGDSCGFREKGLTNNKCHSWGNPVSEIYAEAVRYYAGLTATTAFDAEDDSFIEGLDEEAWTDPLSTDNFCAGLNIVMINSSLSTFDSDETGIFSDITSTTPADLADAVGDAEGLTGGATTARYFVGETATENDERCTAKAVTALGDVKGICPESPTLEGTYEVAGMAHFVNTNDIRTDLDGTQDITTYAVQLSTDVPRIRIPVSASEEVTMFPAIQLTDCLDSPPGNSENCSPNTGTKAAGTLIDFKLVQTHTETAPGSGIFTGKYYSNHEVSEAGGDYDQDLWGTVDYTLDTTVSPATLTITTDLHAESSSAGVLFGFILSGTTSDGFHAYTGMNNAIFDDPDTTVRDCSSDESDGTCRTNDPARTQVFTVGSSAGSGSFLPDPLFLAAKYGGFEDTNDNGLPDLQTEWDTRDTSGQPLPAGDGIPDSYFFVTNPAALEDALRAVFDQVIERVASGTAAAVVASEQEGTGAVFQALYDPIKTVGGLSTTWIGTLHALFIDPLGFLREDADGDAKLDGYDVDKVIEIFFDETERRARLKRFRSTSATEFILDSEETPVELSDLKPIWNARKQLSALSNVTTQRTYTDTADQGRHILTWIDGDYDNLVDSSEVVSFDTSNFTDSNFGWLDIWDGVTLNDDEADKLVNYIRGEEQTGFRSRVLDYDDDGTTEVIRMGDIVNSTPTVMGTPAEAFDILSLDQSYATFREKYRNRRNVVFVGSNDGMIHAFNAGFFDAVDKEFATSLTTEVAHPLGSELWAYIPKNLLGHLQWLAAEDYGHVFYNDLKPLIFDAKIFDSSDADHPGGWGTVLVVGMRLGGGYDTPITLDTQADGLGGANADADATDDVETRSAFVIMDITNPEVPPQVIAEISPPTLGYTTSFPAVVLVGEKDPNGTMTPGPNEWYLMMGSGPTVLGDVESTQTARVFAYDLRELVLGNDGVVETGPFDSDGNLSNGIGYADTSDPTTFVGELTVSDQDLDMKAEAVYFGTVGDDDSDMGNLYRMSIGELETPTTVSISPPNSGWGSPFKLLAANQPFSTRPSITIDEKFRTWVIAGTGRLFTNQDKQSTTRQSLYGFLDPNALESTSASSAAPIASFVDVTNAVTLEDGSVDVDGDATYETTFEAATAAIASAGGWRIDYVFDPAATPVDPSERTVSNQTLIGGIVLSSAFTPSNDLCGAEGSSRILGRAFDSGIVPPLGVFGQACVGCPDGALKKAVGSVDLGAGLASSPSIHIGNQEVPGKVTVIVQQSTGAITGNQAQTLGGLNNGEVSWQEFRSE